jgi:calcium-dependent protein kinase
MGACWSIAAPAHLLEVVDGDEEAYHGRYLEDEVLGQGEFGVVKLVHDMLKRDDASSAVPLACKVLRKGAVFKDNTLYSPVKPEILRGEIEILRALAGVRYCLKLESVYETPKVLYMVTEFCGGGEMMEYVGNQKEDLRTEDVSRIAFQLLSALDHCTKHNVIHRDIKPENVMFQDTSPQADLRLIDFGSGTMDSPERVERHTTFAGSAFYISPEMFQRTYTAKTDVWSAGATFYVLVAGYPANDLQKAFNVLQKNTARDLRTLPNMPSVMPESFYDLLEGCLTYRHKCRPTAGELLCNEFVQFHENYEGMSLDQVAAAAVAITEKEQAPDGGRENNSTRKRTTSLSVKGSVGRHNLFLGFKKFERSLTTLLATLLSKGELATLLAMLKSRLHTKQIDADFGSVAEDFKDDCDTIENVERAVMKTIPKTTNEQRLHVIQVQELKDILQHQMKNYRMYVMSIFALTVNCHIFQLLTLVFAFAISLETMEKLPNESVYGRFAYHVALLKDFSSEGDGFVADSVGRKRIKRRGSLKRSGSFGPRRAGGNSSTLTSSNGSIHSVQSLRTWQNRSVSNKAGFIFGSRTASTTSNMNAALQQPSSVHGTNVFDRPNGPAQRAHSVATS